MYDSINVELTYRSTVMFIGLKIHLNAFLRLFGIGLRSILTEEDHPNDGDAESFRRRMAEAEEWRQHNNQCRHVIREARQLGLAAQSYEVYKAALDNDKANTSPEWKKVVLNVVAPGRH